MKIAEIIESIIEPIQFPFIGSTEWWRRKNYKINECVRGKVTLIIHTACNAGKLSNEQADFLNRMKWAVENNMTAKRIIKNIKDGRAKVIKKITFTTIDSTISDDIGGLWAYKTIYTTTDINPSKKFQIIDRIDDINADICRVTKMKIMTRNVVQQEKTKYVLFGNQAIDTRIIPSDEEELAEWKRFLRDLDKYCSLFFYAIIEGFVFLSIVLGIAYL